MATNFGVCSFRLNDEVNVNIYGEKVAAEMEEMFAEDLARSNEVSPRRFRRRSTFSRIKESIAGLLKPQL